MLRLILALSLMTPGLCLADACDDAKKAEESAKKDCAAARKGNDGPAQAIACGRQAIASMDRIKACAPPETPAK